MTLPEDTLLENRYRIDGLLAHGGMGAIYRAFDTNLSTPVAIKENFFQTTERIVQFKQEALILARLRHPALPRVIHHFSFERQQYLVMDFVEGENLWEMIKRRGKPLEETEALNYLIQVCQAVSYLHRQRPSIIHRDIKPQNIKITPDNRAVLVDFGIAKQVVDDKDHTLAGARAATPGFSPPEQYTGSGTGPPSDVYALGATLYAALTGKKPPNSVSLLTGKVKFKAPNVLNPKISHQTTQAILHAMQPKPTQRPQTVEEWQHRLEAVRALMTPTLNDKDETLASKPVPVIAKQQTLLSKATSKDEKDTAADGFWLVDSRGVGYPLGYTPLQIGRYSGADIVVEGMNVSRHHAQIKVVHGRCLVQDENSANGTLLNGQPLGPDWHPLSQGDVLVIGPARFYLTTTRPAKLAPKKPTVAETVVGRQHPTDKTSMIPQAEAEAKSQTAGQSGSTALLVMVLLVLAAVLVGGGGYLWLNPDALAFLGGRSQPAAAAITPTVRASATTTEEPIAQLESQDQNGGAAQGDATATAPQSATETPTRPATPLITATARLSATVTVTQTATVTATPGVRSPASRTPSGPTPIPLQTTEAVSQLGSREVIDVEINPRNPAEVYALVKRDGIYKSISGGDGPWLRMELDGSAITALVIDPTNPLVMYAPTWNAVLKTTDGGNTWQPKTNGLMSNQVVDVVIIHPANPEVLYAGIGETLVVSADQGENWSSAGYGRGLGLARLYHIVIDPFNSATMYVGGLAGSIYKSENSGQDFVQLPYNVGKGTFGLATHPTLRNTYLAGINSAAAGIIKMENGLDFRPVSDGLIYGGADSAYSAITYAPSNARVVYTGSGYESNPNAKGVFKSIDGGETWQRISRGLALNPETGYPYYVKSIAVHPLSADIVFAATGSGLYKSVNGGAAWTLQ